MFAELQKASISFIMSVYPSICLSIQMEELSSHWTDFQEIWYLTISPESVKKVQVWLKSDKRNRYFPWKPMEIDDNIWLHSC